MKTKQDSLLKAAAEAGSVRAMHEFGLQSDDPHERIGRQEVAVSVLERVEGEGR